MKNTSSHFCVQNSKPLLLGVGLCLVVTLASQWLCSLPFPPFTLSNKTHPIDPVLVAIFIGLLLSMWSHGKEKCSSGLEFSSKYLLATAIVLLGTQLTLHQIKEIPVVMILILILSISIVTLATVFLGKVFRVEKQKTALIAIGNAICGSSAIAALAPVIQAENEDIAISVTIINLIGTAAIFVFPFLAHTLKIKSSVYGIWCGISIQAVPQVLAAGFSISTLAGNLSTTIKLCRVLLLAPIVSVFQLIQNRRDNSAPSSFLKNLVKSVPLFIVLFIICIFLRSWGAFSHFHIGNREIPLLLIFQHASSLMMSMALFSIAMQTKFSAVRKSEIRTVGLAILSAIVLATVSLGLLYLFN